MSDLSQRVKDWAKEGAILGAVANAVMTGALVAIPEGREFIKDLGVPGYIAVLAGVEAVTTLANTGFEISAYYGSKAIDKTTRYIHNR